MLSYQEKKESNDLLSNEPSLIESRNSEMDEITMPGKKRKRKAMFSGKFGFMGFELRGQDFN